MVSSNHVTRYARKPRDIIRQSTTVRLLVGLLPSARQERRKLSDFKLQPINFLKALRFGPQPRIKQAR